MRNKLEVTFEGNHIRVIADGDKDYQFQNRLWQEVAAAGTRMVVCPRHLAHANVAEK